MLLGGQEHKWTLYHKPTLPYKIKKVG